MSASISDLYPRCGGCNKLLARSVTRPWSIQCGRCKGVNTAPNPGDAQNVVIEIPSPGSPNRGMISTSDHLKSQD